MFRPVMAIIRFLNRFRRVYISVWGSADDTLKINSESLQVPCTPTCTQYEPEAHYRHWLNTQFLHTQSQASNLRNTDFNFMYSILFSNLLSWYSETMTLFMLKFILLHISYLWTLFQTVIDIQLFAVITPIW